MKKNHVVFILNPAFTIWWHQTYMRLYNQIWEVAKKKKMATVRGNDKKNNEFKVSVPELTHAGSHDFTRALFLNTQHVRFALCMPWHNTNACCLKSSSQIPLCSVLGFVLLLSTPKAFSWHKHSGLVMEVFYSHPTIVPQHLNVQSICLWIRLC